MGGNSLGVSGGKSQGSSSQGSTSQNVGTAFLANLFGQAANFNERGVEFGGPEGTFAPNLFGPGSEAGGRLAEGLSQLFTPTPRTGLQIGAQGLADRALTNATENFDSGAAALDTNLGLAQEGARTGFFEEPTARIAAGERELFRNTLPDIHESFGGAGAFNTDRINADAQAGADFRTDAFALTEGLRDQANERRGGFINAIPGLVDSRSNFGGAQAQNFLSLGQGFQDDIHASNAGRQGIADLASIFAPFQTTMGSFGRSQNKSGQGGFSGATS